MSDMILNNAGGAFQAGLLADGLPFWGWLAWGALAMVLPRLPAGSVILARRPTGWWLLLGALGVAGAALDFVAGAAGIAPGLLNDALRLPWWLAALVWWEGVAALARPAGATADWVRAPRWLAAELVLMLLAMDLAGGGGQPDWFAPVEWAWRHLPAGLGVAGALRAWYLLAAEPESGRRGWQRAAILGVGGAFVVPCFAAAAMLAVVRLVWQQAAVRARLAVLCAGGFLIFALSAPGFAFLNEARAAAGREAERLERASARVGDVAARAAAEEPALAAAWLRTTAIELRGEGADQARLWRTRGANWEWLAPEASEWTPGAGRAPAPAERTAGGRAFVLADYGVKTGDTTIHAPLRPSRFASPTAWVQLRYPKAGDAMADQEARRGGLALAGAFAMASALGFIFACRQVEEQEQLVALGRAEAASRAKSEFLAFLSHELRTPLQTILGRAGLLRRNGDSDTARQAAAIEEQGRLMLRLVGDLLDLGAVEAGRLELRPTVFSLRERLEVVRAELAETAAAKGLRLELDVAAEVPDGLLGDEARLRQIVVNLWGNAVRHTPSGWARLEVRREASDPNVVALAFRVIDSGPGLPPDKLDRLFTLFTRLDTGADFRREGTGVGLALVRRLCDLMGGSVKAGNRPEGGAEFIARLVFPHAEFERPGAESAKGPSGRKRVLVADDNAAARAYLVEAVRALGHEAGAVADGDAALSAAEAGGWDVLLLDVNMPGRDGIAVARALRDRPERPRMIACSAEAFAHTQSAALAAGMEAFLQKPVDLATLEGALGAAGRPSGEADLFTRLAKSGADPRLLDFIHADWPDWQRRAGQAIDADARETLAGLVHHWRTHALLLADEEMKEALKALEEAQERAAARAALEQLAGVVARRVGGDGFTQTKTAES